MSSTSETGHAKNVANFQQLISFCNSYGARYNPSKASLQTASLSGLLKDAQAVLNSTKTTEVAFNNASNQRADVFKQLRTLSTRLVNALEASGVSDATVKDARTINRKMQGQRATVKHKTTDAPPTGETPKDKTISVSQQSFDQQVEHFSKLVELLNSSGDYKPNEPELQIASLQTLLASLNLVHSTVLDTYTTYSNTRINRDNLLYNPVTGLVSTALDVKKYVKSVYGSATSEFKQVSGLDFRTNKR